LAVFDKLGKAVAHASLSLWKGSSALLAVLFIAALGPSAAPPVREHIWTEASVALAHDLTHAPGECLAANQSNSVEIGRALFRSPALLGGPAARAGLSCNACHVNGRANAHFLLPELTDRAGAADVTSEWSSKTRGDGVMNPRDIPDLVDVGRRPVFGHANEPSLDAFVASVIVDEFQGAEPPPQAFAGIIAYLQALRTDACPAAPVAPITLDALSEDVRRMLQAAENADAPTASLVLLSAQDAVARIVERLPPQDFARERLRLETLSRELGRARTANVNAALADLAPGWRARFDAAIAAIRPRLAHTYFNEATLLEALR
jgi:hypothetical protein